MIAFAAGVAAVGSVIVALFMRTGPTAHQVRAVDGPVEPVTTASSRP